MPAILPTKELVEMFEERIPYGRHLTTAAVILALLAVIVGACGYLYHAVISPLIGIVIAAVTTGKINRDLLGRVASSIVGTCIVYLLFEWMVRGSSRLMREVLDSSTHVLKHNEEILANSIKTTEQMIDVAKCVKELDSRVSALEGHPSQ